jgi:hypothetical protein
MSRIVVTNAADENQIREAEKQEKKGADRDTQDLLKVLDTIHGRRVLWRLMEFCKVFESVNTSSAQIYYNAGRQDVGHFIMKLVVSARDEALLEMMKEAKQGA